MAEFSYEKNRVVLYGEDGALLAEITYPDIAQDAVEIDHTFVDESLRGQGIAGKMMEAAAEFLKKQDKKVLPTCTYAQKWFAGHPKYRELML